MRIGSSRAKRRTSRSVLTYFGARYYAPHLGRWASADPLTIHGLGADLNPYAYVGGRVMSHVDPFGLDSCGADDAKTVKCPQTGDRVTKDGPNSYDIRAPGETIIDETGRASDSGWSRGIEHGAAALERLATTPYEVPGGYTFTPTEYWRVE